MTLDNEDHRDFLLKLVANMPVQGRAQDVREFLRLHDEITAALTIAEVCND